MGNEKLLQLLIAFLHVPFEVVTAFLHIRFKVGSTRVKHVKLVSKVTRDSANSSVGSVVPV